MRLHLDQRHQVGCACTSISATRSTDWHAITTKSTDESAVSAITSQSVEIIFWVGVGQGKLLRRYLDDRLGTHARSLPYLASLA